jgi:hypothetical protein
LAICGDLKIVITCKGKIVHGQELEKKCRS